MGDLNAKPAKKKKMLSPTAGFALKSPMPLVSRGGLDAGQKKENAMSHRWLLGT